MPTTDDSRTEESPTAGGDLDARKAAILNAVVTEYIGSAQPVGSQPVSYTHLYRLPAGWGSVTASG